MKRGKRRKPRGRRGSVLELVEADEGVDLGNLGRELPPYFWTMQPATITRSISPFFLRSTCSRIVSTDSSLARSMKPQVFTRTTRASPSGTMAWPARCRCPSMTSVSTRFFGQPSETTPTEGRDLELIGAGRSPA